MSKYGLLYYPHFEPKQQWLLSTLLFVDTVNRIIPKAAKHQDSRWINELQDVCPNTLLYESPSQPDLWIDDADAKRMYRAFELIAKNYHGNVPRPIGFNSNSILYTRRKFLDWSENFWKQLGYFKCIEVV